MEQIIKWQAIDGELFDDEEECREYEEDLLLPQDIKCDILLLDCVFHPVTDIRDFDEVYYIYVKTDKAAGILNNILSIDGITPWQQLKIKPQAGTYAFISQIDQWIDFQDLNDYTEKIKKHAPTWE